MGKGKAVVNLWDTNTAVASTGSITSKAVRQGRATGHAAIEVILSGSSPSVDISMTVGRTETGLFYSPVDPDGNELGGIYTGLSSSTWIDYDEVVAPWIKFTITGDSSNGADTTARAYLVFEEEL